MKVIDFNGREYILNLDKVSREISHMSSLHKLAIEKIKNNWPSVKIYNEITLIGCKGINGKVLCADIFLPSLKMIVEVNGEQHYNFSKFFHKTLAKFNEYKRNDSIKKEWCEINDIVYIELKYSEPELWERQLYDAIY